MPSDVALSWAGEGTVPTRERLFLVLLLDVTLQCPWSLECFIAASLAARQLWFAMLTDHVSCEVVGVVVGFATLNAGAFLSS